MRRDLYQKSESKKFYEIRYEKGYMDEWPIDKKQRVFEIIRELELPESGNALDFGCGNGVFTEVLRQALPKWKIFGCDISENAINNAMNRYPECSFFVSDSSKNAEIKFDFLFSHHVLEHVFDIKKVIDEINDLMLPSSSVLLIFPCGNEGSFEHKVCKMRTDGINKEMENRFFFEDEGHVRRLTTEQTNKLMSEYHYKLKTEFYSNQFDGAIKWITQSSLPFILDFTNPKKAIDKKAYWYLQLLRVKLVILFLLQLPSIIYNRINIVRKKKLKHYFIWITVLIPQLISYPIYAFLNYKANKEWKNKKKHKNGSAMHLLYNRV